MTVMESRTQIFLDQVSQERIVFIKVDKMTIGWAEQDTGSFLEQYLVALVVLV